MARKEYNIGWRMDSVPTNASLAERMGCRPAPQGLCCLVPQELSKNSDIFLSRSSCSCEVLDEASKTVRVAATLPGMHIEASWKSIVSCQEQVSGQARVGVAATSKWLRCQRFSRFTKTK